MLLWRWLVSPMPPLAILSFLYIFESEWKSALSHATAANMGHWDKRLYPFPCDTLCAFIPQLPLANCEADCITALILLLHQTFHPMFPTRAFYFEPCPFHFLFIFFIVYSPQPQSSDNSDNFHILISLAGRTHLHHRCISKCNILRWCNRVSCSHAVHVPPTLWRRPMQGLL